MSERVERPDLEGIRDSFRVGFTDAYWLAKIHVVVAYALHLEQDAAAARENLAELEWSGDMFNAGGYCFHCGNLKTEGHMPDCGLAALVAFLAAAS